MTPRNAAGLVEYNMDFHILAPNDPAKGNHKILFETPNRGTKQSEASTA